MTNTIKAIHQDIEFTLKDRRPIHFTEKGFEQYIDQEATNEAIMNALTNNKIPLVSEFGYFLRNDDNTLQSINHIITPEEIQKLIEKNPSYMHMLLYWQEAIPYPVGAKLWGKICCYCNDTTLFDYQYNEICQYNRLISKERNLLLLYR